MPIGNTFAETVNAALNGFEVSKLFFTYHDLHCNYLIIHVNHLQRFPENIHTFLFFDVTHSLAPIVNLQANATL